MPWRMTVLGEDRRQYWVAKALVAAGHRVSVYGVPILEDTRPTLSETVAEAQAVVLPWPASDKNGLLRLATDRSFPM